MSSIKLGLFVVILGILNFGYKQTLNFLPEVVLILLMTQLFRSQPFAYFSTYRIDCQYQSRTTH